ncbi:hypothetical protein L596_020199 [Steinernema carpocapsae]|uniref:RING-type E3 ubiquitin transferase n=1 Tax=Steinernema carpocapsae TaxID=34508 RepID=A0A4U5MST6_STECR|nr:hypothetical protein L596_020199 [Steinernema carpocapsae]
MNEKEVACRICWSASEEPLFHPCRCNGSIKYVHNSCWQNWTRLSKNNENCEICSHKFKFFEMENARNLPAAVYIQSVLKYFLFLASLSAVFICIYAALCLTSADSKYYKLLILLSTAPALTAVQMKHLVSNFAHDTVLSYRLPFVGDVNSVRKITKVTFWDILLYDTLYYFGTAAYVVCVFACGGSVFKSIENALSGRTGVLTLNATSVAASFEPMHSWISRYSLNHVSPTFAILTLVSLFFCLTRRLHMFFRLLPLSLTSFLLAKSIHWLLQIFCVGWFVDSIAFVDTFTRSIIDLTFAAITFFSVREFRDFVHRGGCGEDNGMVCNETEHDVKATDEEKGKQKTSQRIRDVLTESIKDLIFCITCFVCFVVVPLLLATFPFFTRTIDLGGASVPEEKSATPTQSKVNVVNFLNFFGKLVLLLPPLHGLQDLYVRFFFSFGRVLQRTVNYNSEKTETVQHTSPPLHFFACFDFRNLNTNRSFPPFVTCPWAFFSQLFSRLSLDRLAQSR